MNFIVMGVCGCGKSSIGRRIAEKFDCDFIDADDYHSEEAKRKMSNGIPLTDQDRCHWLAILRMHLDEYTADSRNVVLACSALRRSYREKLSTNNTMFIYLRGSKEIIESRMLARTDHYMPISLIESQFETLEEPDESEENVLTVDISQSIESIVSIIAENKVILTKLFS